MAEKKSNSLFTAPRIAFFVLSLFVFYLAIHYLDKLEDIKNLLLEMNAIWPLLAIGFQLTSYFFYAMIVRVLLQRDNGMVNFFTLFKISIVILFVNQVLPSGGISGNGYIFNQLLKRKVPSSKAFTALIQSSICFYIAFLILLGIFYGWYYVSSSRVNPFITYTTLLGFAFYFFLGFVMLGLSNKRIISFIINKLNRFGSIRRYIEKVNLISLTDGNKRSMKTFFKNKKRLALAILLQIGIIFCDIFTVFSIIKGFHIPMPFMNSSLGLLLSLAIGALPISPGSLLIYEGAMTYFYTSLGTPVHAALVVTLVFRFFTFWLPIPIGLLFYRNLQGKIINTSSLIQ